MVNPISGIPGYNPGATYLPWPTANQPAARPSTPYRQYATQMGPTAPITTGGGGPSQYDGTNYFDPYGTALGPQIGDWMNMLTGFFGNNRPAATPNTPDPITSAPSSGAAVQPTTLPGGQTVMPVVNPKQPATHVSTGEESLGTLQPGGASPSNAVSDMYYPGFDASNWSPSVSHSVTPTVTAQEGSDLQPQPTTTPISKTDQIFSTGADNPYLKMGIGLAAGMVPGGNIANAAWNAYDRGQANYDAARKGVLPPDWNTGFFGSLFSPASTIGGAIGTSLGKDAGYYDNAPVLSDAASATKLDPSVMSDPNAILNGAYGVHAPTDTTFGNIKAQLSSLFGGSGPSFDDTHVNYSGTPLNPNLGGSDLYTGTGANRFFGSGMSGDMGGAGGYGETEDAKLARMTLGNRWDG